MANLNIISRMLQLVLGSIAATSLLLVLFAPGGRSAAANAGNFYFALLGDRTGEAQPGVYQEAWREATAENPAFVLTVGDTIQGLDDSMIRSEWKQVLHEIAPYRRFKLFLTPGNHDVWDQPSSAAYVLYSKHPLHYSFDWAEAHFTILNNSESDDLKPEEMTFLEHDLAQHKAQPVKFIISHRPSWLFSTVLGNSHTPLHQLALKYGVKYVIAGHLHQMLCFHLDGVTYLSMASSGGHLRNDKAYEHGWFFQHTEVSVSPNRARFTIKELKPPFGKGRVTTPDDWGAAGLLSH